MKTEALEPFGMALRTFFLGETDAELIVRRDDGQEGRLPVSHFFRQPDSFTAVEKAAVDLCAGRVLDAGAGTGLHTLVLQDRGHLVTAIDVCPAAVEIMTGRGVRDARCVELLGYRETRADTILLLGHGIGMVETLAGLDRFLALAPNWLAVGGQMLLDSLDVLASDESTNRAYHEANRRAGRYVGEIRMQIQFRGLKGPFGGWLHVDPGTLSKHAARAGWNSDVVHREPGGDFLARLTRN